MLKRPSSSSSTPTMLADAADRIERRLIVVVEPVRLDHGDPAGAVDRVADHLAIARLENVQRQLRAREQDRAGQAGRSGRAASGSCEQEGRQPPALGARPRVFEALRFEQLEEALARGAFVPFAVAADDLEQRVGRARRGRPPPSAPWRARTAPRDRRDWPRAALPVPPYRPPAPEATSSAARRALISGFFG